MKKWGVCALMFLGGCSLIFPSGNMPPLHKAVQGQDLSEVEVLLDHGAKVNAKDSWGRSALYVAALNGQEEIAVLLLAHGADVEQGLWDGGRATALNVAAEKGETAIVALLLDHGANVEGGGGVTPLQEAAWAGHPETVKLLIERGADVGAKTSDGATALHMVHGRLNSVSEEEYVRVVTILVAAGADVNARRDFGIGGSTPLSDVRRMGSDEAVRILIEARARD